MSEERVASAKERIGAIRSPEDVKALSQEQIAPLCEDLRRVLIDRTVKNGGHLASNLGVVEATVAIHRVFDSPTDHIIFDVGHQSYVHKLLTGRKEQFDTLRQAGGLSGFTKREESEHDAFGAGHSSTAISAAIGMATADALNGSDAYTVAVVGDGALTGGLAYEGLNNCRGDLRLIIVINENEMSISPNTGGLSEHLSRIRSSKKYISAKAFTSRTLRALPLIGKPLYVLLRFIKKRVKRLVYQENLFEQMGLRYYGPLDGNDIEGLVASLSYAKQRGGSAVLHVKTKKGMGDKEAEASPDLYHGVMPQGKKNTAPTFSEHFGKALCHMAGEDPELCAITAAMSYGTGLEPFRVAYPKRFFDVGIAEGHAVTFAAGLGAGGKIPVAALYSTFLQRAYDNVLHDAALQHLPLILAIDRAGFSPADGPTHHGVYDVSLLSGIAGACIFAPVTGEGIAASLHAARKRGGVCAVRYPSGTVNQALVEAFYPMGASEQDEPRVRVWESGSQPRVTVVTHGRIAVEALAAARALQADGISVRVLLCEYLAPYAALAAEVAPLLAGEATLFFEEEIRSGGFGENLASALKNHGALHENYAIVAAENGFVTPTSGQTVWQAAGVDAEALCRALRDLLKNKQ
jgi:1-deoxy-D-xylulose-5-phosphate synthase